MKTRTALLLAGAVVAWSGVRRLRAWQLSWGASDDELARAMPGDDWIARPLYQTTKAITVRAAPEDIWPWLAQLGNGRGGLYSFDWLDRLFGILDAPSATRILPEYQHLQAGDVVPIGKGGNFPVLSVDRERSLVLAGEQDDTRWSWAFALYPQDDGTTRLVTRNRVQSAGIGARLTLLAIDQPAFIMLRQMLLNLRQRAEAQAARERAAVSAAV